MSSLPELSIVMPVYNEGENILAVLGEINGRVKTSHEILVVYDFDADSTLPVIRRHQRELPAVELVRNDRGPGVLNAMKVGIQRARAPFVLITMADGSDEATVMDAMVAVARGGAALVAASRYVRGGRQVGGPPLKTLLSRAAGLSLHLAGLPIHDPTSNFKLYRRELLESVTIESRAGFELALELSVKAALGRWPMAEVPTTWRDRTAGASHFRLRAWLPHYLRWYGHYFRGRMGLGAKQPDAGRSNG